MAITNAQQYKQLLAKGGRIGLKGGADAATASFGKSVGYSDPKTGSTGKADPKGGFDLGGGKGPTFDDAPATTVDSDIVKKEKKKYQKQFTSKGKAPPGLNQKKRQKALDYVNRGLSRYLDRFEEYYDEDDFGITKTGYPNFGFPNIYDEIGDELTARKNIKEIKKTGNKIPVGTSGNSYELSAIPDLDIDSIRELAATQTLAQGAPLTGYQANALEDLKRNIENRDTFLETGDTSVIYPDPPEATNTGPDPDPIDPCLGPNPPAYCAVNNDPTDPATPTRNLGGLAARFGGSKFNFDNLADGGRAGFAEGGGATGGGIESRLEQLGGDVSSAEEMLQAINQRLQTAESGLGGGGGGIGTLATLAGSDQPFNPGPGAIGPNMMMPPGFGSRPALNTELQPALGQPLEELKAADPNNLLPGASITTGGTFNGMPLGPGKIDNQGQDPFGDPLRIGGNLGQIPEQFKSGFDEYLKNNETSFGFGGQALSSVGLPGGGGVTFGDTGSAGAFRDYLKSTGFNPPSPLGQPLQSSLTASGAINKPVGSPIQQTIALADGGRAGYADGGMMRDDPVGGIMDLESGRQMYFLGKLVKKATRAVKKVAKSPVGKAALLYFGGKALMGGMKGSSLFGKGPGSAFVKMFGANNTMPGFENLSTAKMGGFLESLGLTKGYGSMMPTISGGILAASALPLLMGQKEEDEEIDRGPGLNIADIRNNPYNYLSARNQGSMYAADGGLMRTGYAEGSKEPVAKKTMPLLDMDGQEMDLREEGGFVPLGRMERADDVPARLSKNEFVFTADAVRNAGEGDVDKGAEVMYNMMKNLESGGEVSEESQGLEGAREMFQTSQRLEEVI